MKENFVNYSYHTGIVSDWPAYNVICDECFYCSPSESRGIRRDDGPTSLTVLDGAPAVS